MARPSRSTSSGLNATPFVLSPRLSVNGPSAATLSAMAVSRSTIAKAGIVRPGTAPTSPVRQSRTFPPGCDVSPGVSCCSAVATTSRRTSRCPAARSLNRRAMAWNAAKSDRVSHGGSIAGVNACTNGCMSVDDRSCFSYQVADGRTTSASRVELVIRKSSASSRSSFPPVHPRHLTSRGRRSAGVSCARRVLWVPSRCLRKYSLPLLDEPSRLARHRVRQRGQFSGASGSSQANRRFPDAICSARYAGASWPAAATSSARSSGLRSNCGYEGIQPSRAGASVSAVCRPAGRREPAEMRGRRRGSRRSATGPYVCTSRPSRSSAAAGVASRSPSPASPSR